MATHQILLAGFGGQGILFAGRLIAYAGMIHEQEVSWLPSYGPEMRGGTCNCSVILSDEPIASPVIQNPDILIALNLPSLDKFEDSVREGGSIIVDSSLIGRKVRREDVNAVYIPSTQMAVDMQMEGLANMVIIGKALAETGFLKLQEVKAAMEKLVPAQKKDLAAQNIKALEAGYSYNT